MTHSSRTMAVTLVCASWLLTSLLHAGGVCADNVATPSPQSSTATGVNDTATAAPNATTTPAGPPGSNETTPAPRGGNSSGTATAPTAATTARAPPTTTQKRSRVAIPLSFVIQDRNFTADLDDPASDAFRSLEKIVTSQLDQVFRNSTLRDSYITSVVRRFWRGSVGVTSDLLFDTRRGGVQPDSVADAFLRGTQGGTRLGELGVSGPIVPGATNEFPSWSIALLALTSTILLLNIIFLLACAVWCCRRGRSASYGESGATELYYTGETTSYPLYDTHGSLNQSKTVISPYVENSGMTFTNKGMESGM